MNLIKGKTKTKFAKVNYSLCKPHKCDPDHGHCKAADACSYGLMEQENSYDPPLLWSTEQCLACGDCADACPLNAIDLVYG